MKRSHPASATRSICALALALCCAWLTNPVKAQQGPQQPSAAQQSTAQPSAAQQSTAQQSRAREQGVATRRQTQQTEGANRAAAVEDETSTAAQAARTAQSEAAQFEAAQRGRDGAAAGAPSYGPVLAPRGQQQDPARKAPAEVHDETDSLSPQAPAQPANPADSQRRKANRTQNQNQNQNLRRPAWQPANEPMAPRPLRASADTAMAAGAPATGAPAVGDPAAGAVPVVPPPPPTPAARPRPVGPTTGVIVGCQGNACTDTAGKRYNGIGSGNAGVNSNGRLCTRTGVNVQCF